MNKHPAPKQIQDAYALAKERYAALGVEADKALETLAHIPISLSGNAMALPEQIRDLRLCGWRGALRNR